MIEIRIYLMYNLNIIEILFQICKQKDLQFEIDSMRIITIYQRLIFV